MPELSPPTCRPLRTLAALALASLVFPAAARAQNGAVAGTVTRQNGGTPIAGATVVVIDPLGSFYIHDLTDAQGDYLVTDVPPGSWWVFAYTEEFLDEIYADVVCEDAFCDYDPVDPVQVAAGSTTSDIDFALLDGIAQSISGLVLQGNPPAPIAGVSVRAYSPEFVFWNETTTAANGTFTLDELLTGENFLYAGGLPPWIDEFFDDVPCPFFITCDYALGTPIDVVTGAPTSGILVVLAPGGVIEGTVTRSDTGAPLAGAEVQWYLENTYLDVVQTDAAGHFEIPWGLPEGEYVLGALGTIETRGEIFQNLPWPLGRFVGDGTPVVVTGTSTSNVPITPPPHPIFADGCETGGAGMWSSSTDLPVCATSLCLETLQEPRDPACDPCVAQICASNPWCCDVEWDASCVVEVWATCGAPICF